MSAQEGMQPSLGEPPKVEGIPTLEDKLATLDISNGITEEQKQTDTTAEAEPPAKDLPEIIEPPKEPAPAADAPNAVNNGKPETEPLDKRLEVESATKPLSPVADSLREKPPGAVKTPFVDPTPTSKPIEPPKLDTNQQTCYNTLLQTCQAWKEIKNVKEGHNGPLTDNERMWLSRECLLRYLRATKWSVDDAKKRLLKTLIWRREYGVEGLTAEHISPENETGKQLILGFDVNGRPCQYLNPGLQNTETSPRQVQHLVYMLERTIDMMVPGQDTLALLINFKSSGKSSNTAPPLGQGKEVLNILQTHYPERMGRALIINIPWIVSGFFKLISPFIDPLTRAKLKFNDNVREYVPAVQLWKEFQGDCNFVYEHEVYWPALNELCEERRLEQKARWEKAGKQIGESEDYIRGADIPSAFPNPLDPALLRRHSSFHSRKSVTLPDGLV